MNTAVGKIVRKCSAVGSVAVFAALMTTVFTASASAESTHSPSVQMKSGYCPYEPQYYSISSDHKTIHISCKGPGNTMYVQCSKDVAFHRVDLISKDGTGRYGTDFTCPGGPDNMVTNFGPTPPRSA